MIFANRLIQTVWHSDSVPERFFWKKLAAWKITQHAYSWDAIKYFDALRRPSNISFQNGPNL